MLWAAWTIGNTKGKERNDQIVLAGKFPSIPAFNSNKYKDEILASLLNILFVRSCSWPKEMWQYAFSQMMINNSFEINLETKAVLTSLTRERWSSAVSSHVTFTISPVVWFMLQTPFRHLQICQAVTEVEAIFLFFDVWFWVALANLPNLSRDLF